MTTVEERRARRRVRHAERMATDPEYAARKLERQRTPEYREQRRKYAQTLGTYEYNRVHGIGLAGFVRNSSWPRRRRRAAIDRGDRQLAATARQACP